MAEVKLQNIGKAFGTTAVINNLNLQIGHGEFVTLLGPSGCGKSTILRMIAGLEVIDSGDLFIGSRRANNIPAQKRHIAMVFQSYALFPHMTVRNNILFGLKINKVPVVVMQEKFIWATSLFGLTGLENRYPKEISGGQRQRVALARALVLDPEVLLLDEPLSNLDAALREMAMEELKRIHRKLGKTIIYVTHNQLEAMSMSQRIAVLSAGRLEQYDVPQKVYDEPQTLFAAEFIGSPPMNFVSGEICRQNNTVGIETSLGFMVLDTCRAVLLETHVGRSVIVGIRPQNIGSAEQYLARRSSDTRCELTVELFESMGDRILVIGRGAQGSVLRYMIRLDDDIKLDQSMEVFIDGRKIHLFDPKTKMNILYVEQNRPGCQQD